MQNKFTLIINNGRSGSTYLFNLLSKNYPNGCHPIHEGLHCKFTQPKFYNRVYNESKILEIVRIPEIANYLSFVDNKLEKLPVVECGWTMAHLAPIFQYYFKERFQYIIMYRNPISFALSRSTMGNYYKYSFYKDKSHEVSPYDTNTMFPELKSKWKYMNEFDKCLFWWLESMSEAFEFHDSSKNLFPNMVVKSEDLFSSIDLTKKIINLIGLLEKDLTTQLDKNQLQLWCLETFPIKDSWKTWKNNKEVLELASKLGYKIDEKSIESQIAKYRVPNQVTSKLRHFFHYWLIKDYITSLTKIKRNNDIEKFAKKLKS